MMVLILLSGGTWLFYNRPPDIDRQTSCPIDESLSNRTIVLLLDTTQKLAAAQEKKIKDVIFQVVGASQTFDRIVIYEVNPAYENLLEASFDYCKPPRDALGNPVLQKFAKLDFERKLESIFEEAEYYKPTSPIIEALGSISASYPLNGSSKHLIIASDFIENSEILNQHKSSWASHIQNNKLLNDRRPALDRVKISMLFIPRPSLQHHNKDFSIWWRNYLRDSGASLVDQEFSNSETGNSYVLYPFIPITG